MFESGGEGSIAFVNCAGKCPGGAGCHLFGVEIPDGKWKHDADPEKLVKPERDFYYRRFCVKKE